MPAGVVFLGQVAARLPVLEVAYNRCDRRGKLRTDRLLAPHGSNLPMPELRRIIAADCLRMIASSVHDVRGVHFPGLVGWMQTCPGHVPKCLRPPHIAL